MEELLSLYPIKLLKFSYARAYLKKYKKLNDDFGSTYERYENLVISLKDLEVQNSLEHTVHHFNIKLQILVRQLIKQLHEAASKSESWVLVLVLQEAGNELSELFVRHVLQAVAILEVIVHKLDHTVVACYVFAFTILHEMGS